MEILHQDSLLPEGEESDLDAILYITEVIAKAGTTESDHGYPTGGRGVEVVQRALLL